MSFTSRQLAPLALAAGLLAAAGAHAETVLGLTVNNTLITFDSATPGTLTSMTAITGFASGVNLLGLDYRPANGTVVAIGSDSRLYTVNPTTGVATVLPALTNSVVGAAAPTLSGTSFGVDFNPTVDRLRVVSNTGQNLRINVTTGVTIVDGVLNPGTPQVVGAAYTNNFAGATTTTLYDIDSGTDLLYTQTPPNNGTLVAVGPLGVNTNDNVGFDISGVTGIAYASLGGNLFYTVNLASGAATRVGPIFGASVTDITVLPAAVPEPMTPALVLAGLAAAVLVRRRKAV